MTQIKRPLSNNGTIHPDPYGADPINPRGSSLDMTVQPTEGRPGINTSTSGRNGGTRNG